MVASCFSCSISLNLHFYFGQTNNLIIFIEIIEFETLTKHYGGNPVSCSIALAVMDVIERNKLREKALKVGGYLNERMAELMQRHPLIGDIR